MHLKRYRRQTRQRRPPRGPRGPRSRTPWCCRPARSRPPVYAGWLGRREVEVTAAAERQEVSESRHIDPEPVAARRGVRAPTEQSTRSPPGSRPAACRRPLAREIAASHPADRRRGADADSLKATLAARADDARAATTSPTRRSKCSSARRAWARRRRSPRLRRRSVRATASGSRLLAADGFRVGADRAAAPLRRHPRHRRSRWRARRTSSLTRSTARKRPLLVDTAGRSPSDDVSQRDVSRRSAAQRRAHAPGDAGEPLRRSAPSGCSSASRDARPSRVVLTKLDEAETLGPLVGVLRDARPAHLVLGTGQSVPDDLQRATRARARRLGHGRDGAGSGRMSGTCMQRRHRARRDQRQGRRRQDQRHRERGARRWRGSATASACSTPTSASATSTCCSASRRRATSATSLAGEKTLARHRDSRPAGCRGHSRQLRAAVDDRR